MAVRSFDVGLVSASGALVDFYREVFQLEALEKRVFPMATVNRLACGGGVLKVSLPTDAPTAVEQPSDFLAMQGLRYITMWVDDLDEVVGRARARGGTIAMEPREIRPGVRTALVRDPDDNAIEVMQEG